MSDRELNRRQFGKRAAATAALGSFALCGTAVSPSPEAKADEPPQPAVAEPIPPDPIPVELLLLEVLRQQYPDRKLTHEYLQEIRRDIRSELRRAEAIRAVPLQNANEPAALFAAYRSDEGGNVEE